MVFEAENNVIKNIKLAISKEFREWLQDTAVNAEVAINPTTIMVQRSGINAQYSLKIPLHMDLCNLFKTISFDSTVSINADIVANLPRHIQARETLCLISCAEPQTIEGYTFDINRRDPFNQGCHIIMPRNLHLKNCTFKRSARVPFDTAVLYAGQSLANSGPTSTFEDCEVQGFTHIHMRSNGLCSINEFAQMLKASEIRGLKFNFDVKIIELTTVDERGTVYQYTAAGKKRGRGVNYMTEPQKTAMREPNQTGVGYTYIDPHIYPEYKDLNWHLFTYSTY